MFSPHRSSRNLGSLGGHSGTACLPEEKLAQVEIIGGVDRADLPAWCGGADTARRASLRTGALDPQSALGSCLRRCVEASWHLGSAPEPPLRRRLLPRAVHMSQSVMVFRLEGVCMPPSPEPAVAGVFLTLDVGGSTNLACGRSTPLTDACDVPFPSFASRF